MMKMKIKAEKEVALLGFHIKILSFTRIYYNKIINKNHSRNIYVNDSDQLRLWLVFSVVVSRWKTRKYSSGLQAALPKMAEINELKKRHSLSWIHPEMK